MYFMYNKYNTVALLGGWVATTDRPHKRVPPPSTHLNKIKQTNKYPSSPPPSAPVAHSIPSYQPVTPPPIGKKLRARVRVLSHVKDLVDKEGLPPSILPREELGGALEGFDWPKWCEGVLKQEEEGGEADPVWGWV